MIREAIEEVESMGIVAFSTDSAKDSRRVTALDKDGPNEKATKVLKPHTLYLTAVLGTHDRIELSEARRLLGFSGACYTPQGVAAERDRLMADLGYDIPWEAGVFIPTLTLDEL